MHKKKIAGADGFYRKGDERGVTNEKWYKTKGCPFCISFEDVYCDLNLKKNGGHHRL